MMRISLCLAVLGISLISTVMTSAMAANVKVTPLGGQEGEFAD